MNNNIVRKYNLYIEIIFVVLILSSCIKIDAQNGIESVNGIVLDYLTKLPISEVFIFNDKEDRNTFTNDEGLFTIRVDTSTQNFYFSHIGYRTRIIKKSKMLNSYVKIFLDPLSTLLQEVIVYSHSSDIRLGQSSFSFDKNSIKIISNVMPDVLRSFQAFPGISTNNEFSAEYNVRGGNKDENLILINDIELREPFHLRGVANASIGVFNNDLVREVKLITGGFSAQYGNRLSSVADIKFREGNNEKYKGAITLSLAYLNGYFEGPLFNNGSIIFGVRKTYIEYLVDLVGKKKIKSASPSFYDIQGMVTYKFSKNHKLNFSFIHSKDRLKYNPITEYNNRYDDTFKDEKALINDYSSSYENLQGSYRTSLINFQFLNILSKSAFIKTNLSFSDQHDIEDRNWGTTYSKEIISNQNYFDNKIRRDITKINTKNQLWEFKTSIDFKSAAFLENKIGFSYKYISYKDFFNYSKTAINSSNISSYPDTLFEDYGYLGLEYRPDSLKISSSKFGAFVESIFQLGNNLTTNVSGRIDYFDINKQLSISPRFNLAYTFSKNSIIKASLGKYYQSPIMFQLVSDAASKNNTKSQLAIHYLLGIEQAIYFNSNPFKELKIKVDLFYKDYKNLISSFFAHSDRLVYSRMNDAVGYSKGLELYASINLPSFNSWLSYSYLVAKEDILNDDFGEYPRLTAQTHTFAWITNLFLGKNWSFNTKCFYGSGYPYAEKILEYVVETDEYFWRSQSINSKYLPEYQRVDLRIGKEINFDSFDLNLFLEISNVFNNKNVRGYDYKYDVNGNPKKYEITLWPILPSLGVRFKF